MYLKELKDRSDVPLKITPVGDPIVTDNGVWTCQQFWDDNDEVYERATSGSGITKITKWFILEDD